MCIMPNKDFTTSPSIIDKLRTDLQLDIAAVVIHDHDNDQPDYIIVEINGSTDYNLYRFFFPANEEFAYLRNHFCADLSVIPQETAVISRNLSQTYSLLCHRIGTFWDLCLGHILTSFGHSLSAQELFEDQGQLPTDISETTCAYKRSAGRVKKLNTIFRSDPSVEAFWCSQQTLHNITCAVPSGIDNDELHAIVALVFIWLAVLPIESDDAIQNQQTFAYALAHEIRKRFHDNEADDIDNPDAPEHPTPPHLRYPPDIADIIAWQDRTEYTDLYNNQRLFAEILTPEKEYDIFAELSQVESKDYISNSNLYDFLNDHTHQKSRK